MAFQKNLRNSFKDRPAYQWRSKQNSSSFRCAFSGLCNLFILLSYHGSRTQSRGFRWRVSLSEAKQGRVWEGGAGLECIWHRFSTISSTFRIFPLFLMIYVDPEKSLKIELKHISTQCIGSEYNVYYFSQISSHIDIFIDFGLSKYVLNLSDNTIANCS